MTHCVQGVPRARREVAGDVHLPCLQHRGNQQGLPPQELLVHSPGVGVLREPSRGKSRQVGLVARAGESSKDPRGQL